MIDLSSGDMTEDAPIDASPMPDDAEIALHVERARFLSDELVHARAEVGRSAAEVEVARAEADAAHAALERYRRRRSVRLVRRVSGLVRRLTGRRTRRKAGSDAPSNPSAGAKALPPAPGPSAARDAFLAKLGASNAGSPLRVQIAPHASSSPDRTAVHDALAARGWGVADLGSPDEGDGTGRAHVAADVVLVLDSGFDIRPLADGPVLVAWVADDAEPWLDRPWFDGFDLILAGTQTVADRIEERSVHQPIVADGGPDAVAVVPTLERALRAWVTATRFDVAIGTPDWSDAERWGDYHFGRALQRALQRRGHPTRVRFRGGWNSPAARSADVVVHLFGYKERVTSPEQLNALWIISHPAMVTDRHLGRQDVVFVASDRFADHLRTRSAAPVHVLHQATDARRFCPTPGGPEHQLLVVAGRRAERKPTVDELSPTLRDLAVYGHGWTPDVLDPRHHRGDHIPNDRLAAYYTAADIVLNDHWADMAAWGFMSNRLYDAAASGAFIVSDHVDEIAAEFDDGIATFTSGPELRALVTRYLALPDLRRTMADRARTAVLARHTFDHRVDDLLAVITPMLEARRDGAAAGVTVPAASAETSR